MDCAINTSPGKLTLCFYNKTNFNEFTRGATTFQLTKCPVVALTKQRAALGLLQANPTPEPINGEITINHDCVWIQHDLNMLTDDSRRKGLFIYYVIQFGGLGRHNTK